MRVHQLAKSLGVTLDTVRFYTRIKVLQPEKRKANGYHDGTIIEDTNPSGVVRQAPRDQ